MGIARYPLTKEFSVFGKLGGYSGNLESPEGHETRTRATLETDSTPGVLALFTGFGSESHYLARFVIA
jgi:hypothetical protein